MRNSAREARSAAGGASDDTVLATVLLVGILTLVSYTARLHTEAGKFLSREFQENIEIFETQIEPQLGVSRQRAYLSMALLEQLSTAGIALIVSYTVFADKGWHASEVIQAVVIISIIIIIFHRFLPYLFFSRTRGTWLIPLRPVLLVLVYTAMPLTLALGFMQSVVSLTAENAGEEPEHPSEAVDALIEAGQDEGILEESDRELIHSVVEFGDKVVREVMTPRPDVVAVPVDMTVAEVTELIRTRAFSRIPVYEGDLDHIKGILLAHDLLQVADADANTKTVKELMRPELYFVPETKRGSELLREMQRDNIRMAIVIDEYGGMAGVVTIEDIVEEIVGEIRNEREKAGVVRENEHSYIVSGNIDIDLLDKLFDVRVDQWEATTIGGLVSEIAGRIPQPGEVVEQEGLRFEVLESTGRRVQKVRIAAVGEPQTRSAENHKQNGS